MSASLKTPKSREVKPAVRPVAAPAPVAEPETVAAYRPDVWGFKFWLGCVGVLVLLHLLDWFSALLAR
jgi:hypothetical protein